MENIHVPNACNNRKKKHLHTQTSTENIVDIIICSALIYNKQQNGGKRFFFFPIFTISWTRVKKKINILEL